MTLNKNKNHTIEFYFIYEKQINERYDIELK